MQATPSRQRILVVEDDVDIATAILERLNGSGYDARAANTGNVGLELARSWEPDLIVLDLMLPGMSGHEVCRIVQAEMHTPVLMLTALDDETDMLVGLRTGADDYMTKPFSQRELVARIEAILRRANLAETPPAARTTVGDVVIDEPARRVAVAGAEVHLTPTEFNLLIALCRAEGAVLSRADLLHQAWGYADDAGARTVDSHVRSIRRKIGDSVIRTVHGVGYSIEADT